MMLKGESHPYGIEIFELFDVSKSHLLFYNYLELDSKSQYPDVGKILG